MILFICKKNQGYGFSSGLKRSSGLWNSTRFIVESLNEQGIDAEIVEVQDNNCIDKAVSEHKPKIVVIEALWVVPQKFKVLKRLHPSVKWHVHLHSHLPFLALEGIALEWIAEYARLGVGVIANSVEAYEALKETVEPCRLSYLPNVYIRRMRKPRPASPSELAVACYGAVRPLKNQLLQAVAAIRFARELGKPLKFHVNATRVETNGDPVLKNLRSLFRSTPAAELVCDPWFEPDEFISHLSRNVDLGMQVSLSETFNVVCGDYVSAGIPIVVSKEVRWAAPQSQACDADVEAMVYAMRKAYGNDALVRMNQTLLKHNSREAQRAWKEWALGKGA